MSDGINDGHAYFEGAPIASERPADPAGEEKDATLKLSSGLFVQYEEYAKLEAQLVASQAECEQWKTWGIIEIAVRNPNVASYIEHWEGRALKAEENADFLRRSVGACHLMISRNDLSELDGDWDATDLPPRLKKFLANRAQSTPPSPAPDAVREKLVEALLAVVGDDGLLELIAAVGEGDPPFMTLVREALALAESDGKAPTA